MTIAIVPDALPEFRTFADRPAAAEIEALPGCPAVYLLCDAAGAPVQLATTQHLRRALLGRLLASDEQPTRRADLGAVVRGVRWRPTHCPFEARCWHYRLVRALYPREYRRQIGFGPAWFLAVDWAAEAHEIRVTERIWVEPGEFVGPFSSQRAATRAQETLWDLFDLCRYPEQVRRAPRGQRCAYADMGRCDAPCDGSAPLAAYAERTRAAWRFATGAAAEWIGQAQQRMQQAAAELAFERAALLKQQLSAAQAWQRDLAPVLRRDADLNYAIAIRATRRKARCVFLFRSGRLQDGPLVSDRHWPGAAREWLTAALSQAPPETDPQVRMEQTWLIAHLLASRERRDALVAALDAGATHVADGVFDSET